MESPGSVPRRSGWWAARRVGARGGSRSARDSPVIGVADLILQGRLGAIDGQNLAQSAAEDVLGSRALGASVLEITLNFQHGCS